LSGGAVVPGGGGECEDPLGDPRDDAVDGAAVKFEVELAFQRVVDGFDELPDGLSRCCAGWNAVA
jgi:hypothetical protein